MIITAGIYKGRKIIAPNEKITRPTLSKVRMGVFNTLYSLIGDFENLSFLDVFGGSGIMGLEALSRGFKDVKVFELDRKSAEIIKKNYKSLGLEPNLKIGDSLKLVDSLNEYYDVVYIDPPYESNIYHDIMKKIQCGIFIAEHSKNIDFENFELVKQKCYGGKYVSFLKNVKFL